MTRQINLSQEDLAVIIRNFLNIGDASIAFHIEQEEETGEYRISASIISPIEQMIISDNQEEDSNETNTDDH